MAKNVTAKFETAVSVGWRTVETSWLGAERRANKYELSLTKERESSRSPATLRIESDPVLVDGKSCHSAE